METWVWTFDMIVSILSFIIETVTFKLDSTFNFTWNLFLITVKTENAISHKYVKESGRSLYAVNFDI